MKRDGFSYEVHADIEFTKKEIEVALKVAVHHYDRVCREAVLLRAMARLFSAEDGPEAKSYWTGVKFRDLDTIAKTLEMAAYSPDPEVVSIGAILKSDITRILDSLNDEYKRVSGTT